MLTGALAALYYRYNKVSIISLTLICYRLNTMNSYKSITNHISDFLDYCVEQNLKQKTQENYKRFTGKFLLWLQNNNLTALLPHQLTINHINGYKDYLSTTPLKIISQKYYLIALRALLSYFRAKDIVSLPPPRKSPFLRPIKG